MLETNKIYLGNSYELIKEIPSKSVDCIYTDIPYLIVSGGGSDSKLGQRIDKVQKSDIADIVDGIDYAILDDFMRVMKKVNCFIWCSKLQIISLLNYFDKYDCFFDILTWNKTNPTPMTQGTWLPDIEYCLYFREKGVKLNDGYEFKSKWFVSGLNVYDKDQFNHPTIKPLDLVKRHLLHATQVGDVVLDCFSGSGTTCVACKEIDRQFIGIEIDKAYHRSSVDRLNGINVKGQTSIFTDFDSLGD